MKFVASDREGNQLLVYIYEELPIANIPVTTRIKIDACNAKGEQIKLRDLSTLSRVLDTTLRKLKDDLRDLAPGAEISTAQRQSLEVPGKVVTHENRVRAMQSQVSNILKNKLHFIPRMDDPEYERAEMNARLPYISAREASYRE